ncbi:MAG: DUF192 domain-containing protein [Vicinamibacterales bacterium]
MKNLAEKQGANPMDPIPTSDGACFLALNTTRNRPLAGRVAVAATRASRAVGLLGHHELPHGEGLWIVPSRGVHTCWMRFAIDVVALDRRGRVIDLVANLKPWRMRLPRAGCVGVLELPVGSIAESGTRLGDSVRFETT